MDDNRGDVLNGLTTFAAVAETLGFRAAAKRLHVTPAAVSRSIQRLEERLGVRLLHRTTRRVALTREGERYAARCREALAQMKLAEDEIASARDAPHGTLGVSASPILAPLVVSRIARFLLRHPAVRVDLQLTDRVVPFAAPATKESGVEVALRIGPVGDGALVARALLRPRWRTIAGPGYLARRGVPRAVEDLTAHDCLRFADRGRARPWAFRDRSGRAVSFAPRGSLDVDLGDVLVDAALGDAGVAQVLEFMVADHLRAGRLVEVLDDFVAPGPTVHIVFPRGRILPRARAFIDFMFEELGA
jgi:LysR family transcriptional regulator, regulator for bpeEF and oprC